KTERSPPALSPPPGARGTPARLDAPRGDSQCRLGAHRLLSLLREWSVVTCIYRQYPASVCVLHEKITPCRPAGSARGERPSTSTRFPPASASADAAGP